MKILIVEDEALIAMYLEFLVEEFGHQVCATARTSGKAITHAATFLPDVVLMDIRLADGSSGIDAAREIYGRYGRRCIFLSGNLDASTRNAVQSYEPVDFIGKPILPIQLRMALDKVRHP